MGDRRIKLDTAVLAKLKGYNQNPYQAADDKYMGYYPEFVDGTGVIGLNHPLFNLEHIIAIATTQTGLQKWLLKNHKIDVFAYSVRYTGYLDIGYYTYSVLGVSPIKNYKFETFEEALEAGLLVALNKIGDELKDEEIL